MNLFDTLWQDESGSVISAELVLLGTLGVVGVGVGAATVGDSVDAELEEVALSIRSLDQSYHVQGFRGCGAWTAGSSFTQPPVEGSREALRERARRARAEAAGRAEGESASPADGDAQPSEPQRQQDNERRRERRQRMQQRETDRQQRDGEERWDGDEQRDADSDRG